MNGVVAYLLRSDGSFERYIGSRQQMWIGLPAIFSRWFNLERPAQFFFHAYKFGDVQLLSRQEPTEATWSALERFISDSAQDR
jgi:hypothetical protein